ncbi:hypothetical protein [Streptomyces sp. NPDC005303]|uniref:hypothetical protein n=1 Tax=Streptomyces sp. NPDC005303 TaxID=3155713 RepID=UPI0033ACFFE0
MGLTAEGCYGVSPRLAAALDVPVPALERHLANAPAVRERLVAVVVPVLSDVGRTGVSVE